MKLRLRSCQGRFHPLSLALVLRRQSAMRAGLAWKLRYRSASIPGQNHRDFLVGRLTEEDFLRKAGTGGAQREQRQQCQASTTLA